MPERATTYRFGPLERRGLLGPMRTSQAVCVVAGALGAVLVLDRAPSVAGAFVAFLVLAGATTVGTVRVGGATSAEWLPLGLRFLVRAGDGSRTHRSRLPTAGIRARGTVAVDASAAGLDDPPRALRDVDLIDLPYGARAIGAISDRRGRHLTAVLACEVSAFELLERPAQERRLAHWGALMTAAAGSPIRRMQWVERTAPAHDDALARYLHDAKDPTLPARGSPLVDSYLDLIATSAPTIGAHEILLAVQLDAGRVRGGASAAHDALVEHSERIARGLIDGGITVLGALSAGQLARALRTAFDPYARAELAALDLVDAGRDGLQRRHATPLAADERWDHYRTDGACHATFWIGGWPRVDVGPSFLGTLLAPSATVRSVAVTFEPVAPERSAREAEAAVTRDRADSELRRRFGQSETARQRLAVESAARREAELAAGHGEVRFTGFVTVSGRDARELAAACRDVLGLAARARLELYRLYGEQAAAFTYTLPLARGLR